ncbi:MAG: GNAT family N-acetyltransferase [Chloroflexi bacterium]|nr:GNAT family N-acetyltransferase [Chloroflexota bacterium]
MNIVIKPFTEEMIPEAGHLLALRHKRNRALLPLLPTRFEELSATTQAVETLWKKKFKNGHAAYRDGRMVGYLLGDFTVQSWGRCGYVYLPGYALADGEKATVTQDLYCALGEDWVKQGVFSHNLYLCAADANIINAMFGLGFGKERVDALLDLGTAAIPETETPPGIMIRKAGAGDSDHLGSLSDVIMRSLSNAPYWHPTLPEEWEELREGWAELADDKEWTVWLALENNEALGTVGFRPEQENPTSLLVSPRTTYLSVAATKLKARGRGISTSLTWQGLEQASKDGFDICYTNWISPNLPASRFWPRFGFKDVAYRLSKQVNPMISWTRTG